MALQPATRRLLTEAAAAAAYRTAAQVTTEATAQANTAVTAMLTAQKAKPSGLASLGADGLVLTAQLPASGAQTVASYRSTDVALTVSTTNPADVGLSVALTAGTWLIDGFLGLSNFATYFRLFRDTTGVTGRVGGFSVANTAVSATGSVAPAAVVGIPGSSSWLQFRGAVVLTAAKTCNLDVSSSSSGALLYAGSFLTATKIA